jgi:hypothetical protein
VAGCDRGQPIKQPFLARDLRQQHHAEQKQINVSALGGAGQRLGNGNQAERDEQARAHDRPHGFGQIEGPQDNAGCR